jgi:hypothetical protein
MAHGNLAVNSFLSSRLAPIIEKLADVPLFQRVGDDPAYRQRVLVGVGTSLLVLLLLFFWVGRSRRNAEMQRVMNELPAFHDPALGVMFPQVVANTPAHRETLEPGTDLRYWIIRSMSDPAKIEVRVTDTGRRLFTPVGDQILATFTAGAREVTRIVSIEGGDQTRQIRFRYRWTELHPGVAVLGDTKPETGQEYEGEAMFSFENEQWRVLHWTTPLEDAIARFRELGAPTTQAQ